MNVPSIITRVKPIITVILSDEYSEIKKAFRCPNCGKVAFEYFSPVRVIIPGKAEFVKAPIVIQCKGAQLVEKNGTNINTRCKTRLFVT